MSNIQTQRIDVEQLADTTRQLPPLPQTTNRIITILGDPLFEVGELIKVVALDPTLTANLLRMANSAASGSARSSSSVGEAIVRLGTGTVLSMSLAASCRPPRSTDLSAFGLTLEQYWRHCLGSVAAADELVVRRIASFGNGFSAAALLHDVGKLILSHHLTPLRLDEMAEYRDTHPGLSDVETERAILGVDHATAGGLVSRHWNLPEEISYAIEHHHSPCQWDNDCLNGIVIANQIARENEGDNGYTVMESELVADAMLALGLDDETYQSVCVSANKRFELLFELMS